MSVLKIDLEKLRKSSWSEQETKHVELVLDFVQNLMNDHNFDYVMDKFGQGSYIQHNRGMLDGVQGVVEYVSGFVKRFPDFTYDVKHIYVDGQYVIFHSHSTANKKDRGNPNKGFNIMDTWKVEEGQLVEHWDAIQPINGFMRLYAVMAGGSVKNENTLF
ncbi:MAG: nuclear transport factor 2 family protein [Bacteroidota bacterium]